MGGGPGGLEAGSASLPPGFESAARREHASERMALTLQHQQEERERQQELVGDVAAVGGRGTIKAVVTV